MTTINAPRDDEGVIRHSLFRNSTGLITGTQKTQRYPALETGVRRPQAEERRSGGHRTVTRGEERRAGERRRHDVPVTLDTRSGDRRRALRRSNDHWSTAPEEASAPLPGQAMRHIDVYA